MGRFAVIDTETNWNDQVMSIGTVIADEETMKPLDARYHILTPEYTVGGMFEGTLFLDSPVRPILCTRAEALRELKAWFSLLDIRAVFAYNACFDRNHLPELRDCSWYDIMRLAAYRQYNERIPVDAPCCATGRLKRGYGVEAMLRLLSGRCAYCETHNAIHDAIDELKIMQLLGIPIRDYIPL